MKKYKLTKEEQELLEAVENGEFVSAPNFEEEKKRFQLIAKNTLKHIAKTKNISVSLSEPDLKKLKQKASESGVSFEALASSILHKFVTR